MHERMVDRCMCSYVRADAMIKHKNKHTHIYAYIYTHIYACINNHTSTQCGSTSGHECKSQYHELKCRHDFTIVMLAHACVHTYIKHAHVHAYMFAYMHIGFRRSKGVVVMEKTTIARNTKFEIQFEKVRASNRHMHIHAYVDVMLEL